MKYTRIINVSLISNRKKKVLTSTDYFTQKILNDASDGFVSILLCFISI